jgi:hypothetical protein
MPDSGSRDQPEPDPKRPALMPPRPRALNRPEFGAALPIPGGFRGLTPARANRSIT